MTMQNLDRLFRPRSVVLVGPSRRAGSVGAVVARNLVSGGLSGTVMMVNPHYKSVEGIACLPTVAALPAAPDLGVVATPPETVPGIIADLAARGTRAAVVITAGLGAGAEKEGKLLRQAMLDAARPKRLRIVGPNCLGILNPQIGLNASFAHVMPRGGSLAFVAQSGAVIAAALDWATTRQIGFSHMVSLGDMADVDFGDMLDFLAQDAATRAILLYVEMITNVRKFMSAARAAARIKPVIVVKAGRHAEGARAAASHTGALAGQDIVYDAAFRRAGMLRVLELRELFTAVETLSRAVPIQGDRLAIITNGGGMGVLATDRLIDEGGRLAELALQTLARLDAVLPPAWPHANPVDIIGDADGARYGAALEAVLADAGVDATLVLNCPTAVASSSDAARAVAAAAGQRDGRTVLTSWVGAGAVEEGRTILRQHGLPTYETPEEAVHAFMHLVSYRRNQQALLEVPPSTPETFQPDRDRVRAIIDTALAQGGGWLSLPQALEVLSSYRVPVVETRVAADPEAAAEAAGGMTPPYVLKILSPDVLHKSDVGGVALNLTDAAEVAAAARRMIDRVRTALPNARLAGFTVQSQIRRAHAEELLLGIVEDQQFGPVILFGQGGTATEIIGDRALELPPLNLTLAAQLMGRTKVHRLLQGYRNRPPAALDRIALTLVQLSQLAVDHPEIVELDINPLLADADGVIVLDGRIRLAAVACPGLSRLAIRPYPRELATTVTLRTGETVAIRPVRPEDVAALRDMFGRSSQDDLYLRFLQSLRRMPEELAARLTQIDYEREMALAAFSQDPKVPGDMLGIVHLAATPDRDSAEFAVIVRSDLKGRGLGYTLMISIIRYAGQCGIRQIYGHVLRGNAAMLRMSRELGFQPVPSAKDDDLVRVELDLDPPRAMP